MSKKPTTSTPPSSPSSRSALVPLVGVLVAIAVTAALKAAASVFIPFVIAMFLVYLIRPMMNGLHRLKVPDFMTIPAIVVIILVLVLLMYLAVFSTISEITDQLPSYVDRIEGIIDGLMAKMGTHATLFTEMDWLSKVSEAISSFSMSLFGSVVTFVANLVLVLMYTAFILAGRKALAARVSKAFPSERASSIRDVLVKINDAVQRYIVAKILISLATGLFMFIALLIFGVDFALFWGLLGFLLNFIPSVGSIIACLFPILLALVQFDDPWTALWIAIILIGIQQVIGNVIEPMILGGRLNLSPLVVLFALVFFGWLWGFWGMVLSIPLTSVTKIAMEQTPSLRPFAVMLQAD